MSTLPQRGQFVRLGVEQGAVAVPGGVDDDEVSCLALQAHRPLPPPRQQAVRRAEQPAVQVADKQDTARDRRKAPGQLLRRIGRGVEVPVVFDPVRVQPGLDVREQAAVDLQAGL
jgi:hypothetical protein